MKRVFLWVLVALLTGGIILSIFWSYKISTENKVLKNQLEKITVKTPEVNINDAVSSTTVLIDDNTTGELAVTWNKEAVKVVSINFFNSEKNELFKSSLITWQNNNPGLKAEDYLKGFTVYRSGMVNSGAFSGRVMYIIEFPAEMGRGSRIRVIDDNGRLIWLPKYSELSRTDMENYYTSWSSLFLVNEKLTIPSLEIAPSISLEGVKYNLKLSEFNKLLFFNEGSSGDSQTWTSLHPYQDGFIYTNLGEGCLYVKNGDSTYSIYSWDTPLNSGINPKDTKITWTAGALNQDEYIKSPVGRCGLMAGCLGYVEIKSYQLIKAGTAGDGSIFYELKDKNFKFPNQQKSRLEESYEMYYPGATGTGDSQVKLSYASFLNDHPVIYWQDPFGNFAEFIKTKYRPAVECGKPVIYLYPQQEIDVSVKVSPTGGLTVTEPAYNEGWKVKAKPTGELYNYADQKNYPYLFWEGHGLDYARPDEGFVVKQAEVKSFLSAKLTQLGLIQAEADEFMDFWLPRMQDRKYYFVTFVPQSQFNLLAPLSVSPQPDTVIRVFMDYEGLDQPYLVRPQKIVTPIRQGFTVVEWGGALRK